MICEHRKLTSQTDVGFPVNKVEMVLSVSQCYCRVKCLYSFWKLIKWIISSFAPVNIITSTYLCNSVEFICYSVIFDKVKGSFSSLIWNVSHTNTAQTDTYIHLCMKCVYIYTQIHTHILYKMLYILYIWRKRKRENKYHKLIPPQP